jgi:hypothetical protein
MFMAAVFIIAPNWKQCRQLSAGEWLDNHGMSISWNSTQQFKGKNLGKWPENFVE